MARDPFANMNPELVSRVQAMITASGGRISPGSGHRTVEEQAALRIKNGCPDVWKSPARMCRVPTAIPGRSNHQHGLAMDLKYSKDGAAWAAANAAKFGLHFPVKGENWHVEMIDDDGARPHMHGAEQQGAIGFDLTWQDEQRTPQDELAHRLDTVVKLMIGQAPGAATPAEMTEQLATETTTIPGGQPSVRQGTTPMAGGGEWQGDVPPPGYVPAGKGVDRWRPVLEAALRYTGVEPTPDLVALGLRRMNQESGGNPSVVNNWDSNARRGDPTTGLMQNIPSAFPGRAKELASRGITDGFANIVASIRYTLGRYGSLQAGWGRKGGY